MISAATIAVLEQRKLDYILGVRERGTKEVREIVMADPTPSVPLVIPHQRRPDTDLRAKEVKVDGRRYTVCRNRAEVAQAARTRKAVLTTLRAELRQGDKLLDSNSAYRRYLKTPDEQHFSIVVARIAEDARYDGLYILRANTRQHPLNVMAGRAFSVHQTDAAIRSFLAVLLCKELEERLATAQLKPEWRELLADLQEIEVEQDGKHFILRTPVTGVAGKVFQAVGTALLPNIRDAVPPTAA